MSSSTINTYRQYKHGTKAMFEWLSKSLKKLGITFDRNLEDTSIRGKDTSAFTVVFYLPRMNENDYLLTGHTGLLDLASQAQRKGASMPYEVLYALEDALKIRRQHHAWYSSQLSQSSSDEDKKHIEQSNEAHAAFIDVLQYIHDLFAPAKAPANQPPSSTSSDKRILEISNLFANLKAEDVIGEETQATRTKPLPGAGKPAKPWVVRKSQMLIEDKLLELYCLYDDAHKIRTYVRGIWAEYASRKMDIISAAVITQEALELFSEAEKSFERKYGTIPEDAPNCAHPKHLDIFYHLAIGEPMTSTYTLEKYTSMSAAEIETARLRAQSLTKDRQRRMTELDWKPSKELDLWLMRPTAYILEKFLNKVFLGGDAWVLEQACCTPADRADALNALDLDDGMIRPLGADAQELLITFINFYAGIIFLRRSSSQVVVVTDDVITSLWLGKYDCSIRMILSMQILHDIRTAKSESGQLNILTQVSEDYKKLGHELAALSQPPDKERRHRLKNNHKLQEVVDAQHSLLRGRVPGQIHHFSSIGKAESQKLSELPLTMNPVLAGMVLFGTSYIVYESYIIDLDDQWLLIPCAHLLNWFVVRTRGAKADFQSLWPDIHTTIGLIGPRSVWVGDSPPETLDLCRNRILLAWGFQLKDFYQRILSGDIPTAEDLFRKIRNNTNELNKPTYEELESMLSDKASSNSKLAKWKSNGRLGHLRKIETSQCTPLMYAIQENLVSSGLMKAQQDHIRKIILAPGSKRKREELDMMSHLDAFSRTVRAEIPRLLFPYQDVSHECWVLSLKLFLAATDSFALSSELRKCADSEEFGEKSLRTGAQSVSSLLALSTIFGDRAYRCPIERLMLETIEKHWDKDKILVSRDNYTKKFVEKCKEFGFAVPECATAALP